MLNGPFWPGPVQVIGAKLSGGSVQTKAVGLADGRYYDRTLTLEQFRTQVRPA